MPSMLSIVIVCFVCFICWYYCQANKAFCACDDRG